MKVRLWNMRGNNIYPIPLKRGIQNLGMTSLWTLNQVEDGKIRVEGGEGKVEGGHITRIYV